MIPQGNPTQLYAVRVCAGTTRKAPLRPPFRAVREIPARAPPAGHALGAPVKPSLPNKKAMGAFMLHGFD